MYVKDEQARFFSAMEYLQPPEDYISWRDCLFSLKAAGIDEESAKRWSMKGSNYNEQKFNEIWHGSQAAGGITPATFIWYAQRAGWREPEYLSLERPTPFDARPEQSPEESQPIPPPPTPEESAAALEECKRFIAQCSTPDRRAAAIDYWTTRGFTAESAERWRISTTANQRLFIPYPQVDYYATRSLNIAPNGDKSATSEKKYLFPPKVSKPVFNLPALQAETVFLVEGQIDAISLEESGARAIAGDYKSLFATYIAGQAKATRIIIIPDNDAAGMKKAQGLEQAINKNLKQSHVKAEICPLDSNYHDCNDFFKRAPEDFKKWIYLALNPEERKKEEFLTTTLATRYPNIVKGWTSESSKPIPTGLKTLDEILDGGLYAGLYTLGAVSSLGKTTIALQIASEIAAAGHDVLYFALEMSAAELAAKILSRLTKEIADANNMLEQSAWNVRDITNKEERRKKLFCTTSRFTHNEAEQRFNQIAQHLYIFDNSYKITVDNSKLNQEGNGNGNGQSQSGNGQDVVNGIAQTVQTYKTITTKTPVLFIDYIQILTSPVKKYATDKQIVDENIVALKDVSRKWHLPIFAISSLNRDSYSKEIDLNAFKESGAIEYTSDVILGLQPQGMQSEENQNAAAANKKKIRDTRNEDIRKIELRILKQRNGRTGDIKLTYQAAYNRLIDDGELLKEETERSKYTTPASRTLQLTVIEMLEERKLDGRQLTLEELAGQYKNKNLAQIRALCSDAGIEHDGTNVTRVLTRAEYDAKKAKSARRF